MPAIVRREDRGLTIEGTRVTLYALMDYLRAGWDVDSIRSWLNLTNDQVKAALAYIAAHREEVNTEYAETLREAEERQRYWEERLSEHLARKPPASPSLEKAVLYARLATQRAQTLHALFSSDADSPQEMQKPTDVAVHQ
ncbi:MAG TPA: DUF433 domain-containing protein [Ktedonobacterales bacterium]|nr:DUF433 domain-containing protein [Ktedonobacterales bacterium]